MTIGRPFDDIRDLVAKIPEADENARLSVSQLFTDFHGPKLPLGFIQSHVEWLAGWQGTDKPQVQRPLIAVFAGTHGVAKTVVGGDIVAAAKARVTSLTEGEAGVRGIAGEMKAAFKVYEMGVEFPTADMTAKPSLSERDCAAAIAFGMEVVAEGADVIVLGNAGYGSATAAAGIARGLYGGTSAYWAGGEGEAAELRIAAVEAAARLHRNIDSDALEVLRHFGGRDIAGLVGAILAARHQSIPVILDGYVVCSAAAVLHKIAPNAIDHCIAGHITSEPGHAALLDRIGKRPLLDLGVSLGDGTGAAFALGVLRHAASAALTIKGE